MSTAREPDRRLVADPSRWCFAAPVPDERSCDDRQMRTRTSIATTAEVPFDLVSTRVPRSVTYRTADRRGALPECGLLVLCRCAALTSHRRLRGRRSFVQI